MRIYIIGIIIIALIGILSQGYITYNNMVMTITNQNTEIRVLENTIVANEKIFKNTLVASIAKAVSKEKRKALLKEIKYDKSNSVSIQSTRYYIAH
jgi:hypothetical protein